MSDFDQHRFAAQAFMGITGAASVAVSSMSSVGPAIDQQRLRDQDVLNSRIARARSRVARRRVEAVLDSIEASDELRRASIYAAREKQSS
jgi:hypothetical protein